MLFNKTEMTASTLDHKLLICQVSSEISLGFTFSLLKTEILSQHMNDEETLKPTVNEIINIISIM
jgi:hypothetical protein